MENRFLSSAARALVNWAPLPVKIAEGTLDLPMVDGHTPLTQAVCVGDDQRTEMLLARGADANARDLRGVPPLVYAAANAQGEMVEQLLKHGAAVDAADANGRVAAHYAFYRGQDTLIETLQDAGADFSIIDVDGRSVVDFARARHEDKDAASAKDLSTKAEDLAQLETSTLSTSGLHGDPDFRRLDMVTQDNPYDIGLLGIGAILGIAVFIALVGGSPLWGCLGFYLVTTYLLMRHFRVSSSDTPREQDALPDSGALASAGSPLRVVQEIVRATSRAQLGKLDSGLDRPADLRRSNRLLLALALVAPFAAIPVAIGGAIWAWLVYQLVQILPETLGTIAAIVVGIMPGIWIVMGLVVAPVQAYAWGARRLLRERILARQSALSQHINQSTDLRRGGQFAEGGVVYLRSFDFDGSFVVGGMDFELMMLTLFHKQANVYALNAEDSSHGVVNLKTTDADWKKLADDMIARAGQVIIIPADSKGVLDEIDMLQTGGWFAKTLFIAPPQSQSRNTAEDWERMRLRPELRGLELPPYCGAGFLFRLGLHGKLQEYGPLGIDLTAMPLWAFDQSRAQNAGGDGESEGASNEASGSDHSPDGGGSSGGTASGPSAGGAAVTPAAAAAASAAAIGVAAYAQAAAEMDLAAVMSSEEFAADQDGADGSDGSDGGGFDGGFGDGGGGDGGG